MSDAPDQSRARDPGVKLGQVGRVVWVHCPDCDGPAKIEPGGAKCVRCGYMTMPADGAEASRWARIRQNDPRCAHCRQPLPTHDMPTGFLQGGERMMRIRCPHCRKIEDYRAEYGWPPAGATRQDSTWLPKYLVTQVGGQSLWVDNLAHLEMLAEYLGAKVRERGPVRGLTMMARLPAWMKEAGMRPKIVRALDQLRERARAAGIDE